MVRMVANMKLFYERIRSKLAENGQKRSWLLKQTGIKPSTWSSWEKFDRLPPADRALAIADKLSVSLEFLVTGRQNRFDTSRSHTLIGKILQQLEGMSERQLQRVLTAVNTVALEEPES